MTKGWLIGGGVLLAALLTASIVVALMDKAETLPEGSPEAAVQRFLTLVEEEDLELAYGLLSEELRQECAVEKFAGGALPVVDRLEDDRVTLDGTRTVGDTVFVTVRVTRFHGSGPFGPSESSFRESFSLLRQEEEWRFSEYPWPFHACGRPEPVRRPPEPAHTPAPTPTASPQPTS